jgi:membrane associated rhomboid family serine protease
MKIRLIVAGVALGGLGPLLLTGQYGWVVAVIAAYAVHIPIRHAAKRRAFERTWTQGGGTVYRVKGSNFR